MSDHHPKTLIVVTIVRVVAKRVAIRRARVPMIVEERPAAHHAVALTGPRKSGFYKTRTPQFANDRLFSSLIGPPGKTLSQISKFATALRADFNSFPEIRASESRVSEPKRAGSDHQPKTQNAGTIDRAVPIARRRARDPMTVEERPAAHHAGIGP